MTKEQEIIWLAGLLEGEGCFMLITDQRPRRRVRLCVSLRMCDKDVVMRAATIFPAIVSTANPTGIDKQGRNRDTWSTSYVVRWHGLKAEQIMRVMLPYMGERRSAKIRECLSTPNLSHHPKERKVTP